MNPTRDLITNQTARTASHSGVNHSERGVNAGDFPLPPFAPPAGRLAQSLCAWLAGLGLAVEIGLCAPGDKRWEFDTGQYVRHTVAIGQDGTVFVVSNPTVNLFSMCKVWALDGATGQKKWEMPTGWVQSSPAVGLGGRVVFAAAWVVQFPNWDARVVALDPASGAVAWEFKDAGSLPATEPFPAIGQDGTVYFGSYVPIIQGSSYQHQVYAMHGANGGKMAGFDLPYSNGYGPAIATDGTVYVGQINGAILHARDGITLNEKWHNELERFGSIHGGPIVGPDGTVYVATPDSFYALDPVTGTKKWDYTPPGSGVQHFSLPPAIGADGTIFVPKGQEIVALDPATGTQKWRSIQGSGSIKGSYTSLAVAADGTIYFVDPYGVLFALDELTGAKKWDSGPKDGVYRVSTHPNIGGDGTVYFTSDKTVYAIEGAAPLANSSWPKFQADQFNSGRARLGGSPPPKFHTPTLADGKVVISWDGEIRLFKGSTPEGPWEEILNPEKPFLASPALDGEFFLLRQR